MSRKSILITLVLVLLSMFPTSYCQDESSLNVVASISPIGEFVRVVGGERVNLTVLVPPGAEPHTYEPLPSQMASIEKAQVYVKNGAGLETWMDRVTEVNPKLKIIDSSNGVDLIYGSNEDDNNDGTNAPDPHIWLSPKNAIIQVQNICEGLVDADPSGKAYYEKNRDDYVDQLKELDSYIQSLTTDKDKRSFLTEHAAWTYFARDYGLTQIALEQDEKEPGPKYLSSVIDRAKADNITTIFVEPQFNIKTAETVSREIDGQIVVLDPLSSDYVNNMKDCAEKIAGSLVS